MEMSAFYMYITESLHCIAETNIVNQLYFNKNIDKKQNKDRTTMWSSNPSLSLFFLAIPFLSI